jgi:hypothetical protein
VLLIELELQAGLSLLERGQLVRDLGELFLDLLLPLLLVILSR